MLRIYQTIKQLTNKQTVLIMNKEGKTALHLASLCGFQEIVSFLIQNGSNVASCDKAGNTPLHYAAMSNSLDCVKVLIQSGADPLIRNRENVSPFALSSGEISAFLRTYVEQKKESVFAVPVEKNEISTRASPSRLKSRSASKQSQVLSPSRSRISRGSPSKSPTKRFENTESPSRLAARNQTNAVMRTLNPRLAKTHQILKDQPQTCNEYQQRIEDAVKSTNDAILAEIKVLKDLVQDLRDDLEEENNRAKEENQ